LLDPEAEARPVLLKPLIETSRRILRQSLQEIGCQLIGARAESSIEPVLDLLDLVGQSFPGQPETMSRALVVTEGDEAARLLKSRLDSIPGTALVTAARADVTVCAVGAEEPIGRIAARLTAGVKAYEDLATRVQTRTDLTWIPLSTADSLPPRREVSPPADPPVTIARTAAVLV
jgi:hypothetical protein